ncbi:MULTISPECIES: TRAP transporter large permease subunit [unclassified Polaromonas]|jgi:TRAP-type mannitol/chloroaromatic compound transport system permease large subunit|uniref:TRAP transporter large permease n=1 Tax=unclassified Polaromonas TaxID=2638319 RepID=UPI000BD99A89|nr:MULTISPECIES: TRAP transporter large permease subunit [unclassified Polaromonas]OYY39727.1 MAG: C4-dicarboxylate ABC transporter [Polaromonas sp. 35-63-35]OYZ22472.1 MAG: C4-dicarboxylate ABC transporter [Polaromonas sp. 16-63-31]OYZ81310.1 MAG: C4-dicarboxylate ABC transporter [Polaromonas sp. 24-63-21]OZA52467.1 MAG: C4-dicarboxylate ABC transporter [Polaromonas sp. 17-63-33]OZA88671.1 MAG: C4-dicarboxylate ABC transporter [Polaromonas sp. 39-63-25]
MKIRKELWFGLSFMALVIIGAATLLLSVEKITNGHLGLLMLSLVVTAIMLGFPTAFTLMGMGMIFTWLAYNRDTTKTLDLMVQAAFKTMASDVLIAIPLFVFMGYLVERANLIEKLFKSLHLAMARIPGSLAVATLVTCAIFATATGIVGAVVTLMGLLALPAMLRAGYSVQLAAGAITAGGCLGILIPPSVLLIVYGATAGVSVVQLYAGAFFPGLMLTGLYILYVILIAKLKPQWAPPLSAADRVVTLPPLTQRLTSSTATHALTTLFSALKGKRNTDVPLGHILRQLTIVVLPGLLFLLVLVTSYRAVTTIEAEAVYDIQQIGASSSSAAPDADAGGLQEPPQEDGLKEPVAEGGLQDPPSGDVKEPPGAEAPAAAPAAASVAEPPAAATVSADKAPAGATTRDAPTWWWVCFAIFGALVALFYLFLSFARLEIFKMLLTSFFPLMILIISVLGSIVMGLATPTEAAAMGALGGFLLAVAYKRLTLSVLQESVFLTAKTSAMVCWLFVGSAIFSAAFALLGGQELVETWVLSMNLSKTQFLVMSQAIIFILGWPLEWTEIIVIFMPIFIPLLDNFGVDPLFFGLLVALNLQTAFLSPPVAMAAFYLKGVAPKHVTLNQIFAGMLPFMGIQILAIVLLYQFPAIGLWLPQLLYK